MTDTNDLEPPAIGDMLIGLERHAHGFAHDVWHGAPPPFTVAGTSIPGNIRLQVGPLSPDPEPLPLLDLSWSPPDVEAILDGMLVALRMTPSVPDPVLLDALRHALAFPDEDLDATATTEMIPVVKEEE